MKLTFSLFKACFFLLTISIVAAAHAQETKMATVKGGTYIPLYGADVDGARLKVTSFQLDIYPVTNAQFLTFLKANPGWRRSKVKRLFADERYLIDWEGDLNFGKTNLPAAPITNVSWFAAKKYCECQGKRLATMDEWEYAAMADEKLTDARTKTQFNSFILSWYEKAKTDNNPVGSTFKNYWGIYDLHGLVWEWTSDFNSVFIAGESRKAMLGDANLFCGSSAVGASDLMNYAAFMRYAFRGSIKASYSTKNLGFRCAKSL